MKGAGGQGEWMGRSKHSLTHVFVVLFIPRALFFVFLVCPFCHHRTRRLIFPIFIEQHSSQARQLPSILPSTLTNYFSFS